MKLKYYLRGVGIGILVTTIIFMIAISIHKEESEPQNNTIQATESKTVAQVEKEASKVQETTSADTQQVQDTQETDNAEAKETERKIDTEMQDAKPQDSDKTSSDTKPEKDKSKEEKNNKKDKEDKKNQKSKKSKEKVRIEVGSGEYSDVICNKLKTEGLIDDAEKFNDFLIKGNYDNFILPGIYDIPRDSTYEEIAVLLTTKVE